MASSFELNGNGINSWVKAVATVGLPSIMALILTVFLIYNVMAAHDAMAADLQRVEKKVEQLNQLDILIRIGRQTCINTAPDTAARLRCLE